MRLERAGRHEQGAKKAPSAKRYEKNAKQIPKRRRKGAGKARNKARKMREKA